MKNFIFSIFVAFTSLGSLISVRGMDWNKGDNVRYLGAPYGGGEQKYHVLRGNDETYVAVEDESKLETMDPTSITMLQVRMHYTFMNGDFSKYTNLKRLIICGRSMLSLTVPPSLEEMRIDYAGLAIQSDVDLSACKSMKKLHIEVEVDGALILPPNLVYLFLGGLYAPIKEIIGISECKSLEAFSFYLGSCPGIIHIPHWVKRLELRGELRGKEEVVDLSAYDNLEYMETEGCAIIKKLILPSKRPEKYTYKIEKRKPPFLQGTEEVIGDLNGVIFE